MNFLNKKTRNKIMAQALIGASVFGIGTGYNLIFTPPIQVYANTGYTTVDGNNYYIDTTTKIASVSSIKKAGDIVIPSTITSLEMTFTVTGIDTMAFQYNTGLTSVTIPSSVTSIGKNVFYGCTNLTSITIPNSVTSIGQNAFNSCTGLTSIYIKNTNTQIGYYAFDNCSKLTTYGLGNINYTLNQTAKTATIPSGTVGAPSTIIFNKDTYTVIIPDTTAPTLTLTPNTTNATNGTVTITATGSDNVGVASITKPDNTIATGSSTTYVINTNGTYAFKVTDTAGNTVSQSITVSNIDKTAPVITLGSYDIAPTNGNITVTASTNEGTLNATSHIFTSNGSFDFVATDSAGNKTTKPVIINNIDTVAITAVVKTEGSKLQADVTTAQSLVTALANGTYKTGLQTRLTAVQTYITNLTDATAKVTNAETTKTQANVDTAQTAINLLPTGTDKTNLQTRLDVVKAYIAYQAQLSTATTAVVKAEGSKLQSDVDSAKTLVNALTNVTDKTNLTNRLNIVQTAINKAKQDALNLTDATTKVTNTETTKTQANVDLAQISINLLPTGDANRVALQTRLDVVKAYIAYQAQLSTATTAVVKAEGSKLQADVDSAKILVNALTNVTDKTNLTNRLTIVQTAIDKAKQDALNLANATAKVTNAETKSDVDSAQTAIDVLPNNTNKTDLQNQLDIIKAQIDLTDATSAVIKAEGSKLQSDVDSAKTLVNALTNVTDKTNLTNRLNVVQTAIDKAKQDALNLADATTKVTNAETTKTQANVDLAQTAINLLPTGTDKTNLQTRLDVVKTYIAYQTQLTTATTAVVKADGSKLQADVDSAKTLVNALTNVTDKTNLTNRLNVVQTAIDKAKQDALNLTDATTKVTTSETTKTQANVDLAQTAINLLPTGTDKTALQTRLDVVKVYIAYQTQLDTATTAVVKTEGSKLQADVDSAKVLVNALTNVTDKTNLTNRLNTVQTAIDKAKQDALNLTDATTKVINAETTKTQANVDSAKALVNALPNGSTKTDLLNRLNVVQTILDAQQNPDENDKQLTTATDLVNKAETAKDTISILKAQTAINNLKDSADKTDLQNRLDVLKEKNQQEEKLNAEFKDVTEKVRWAEAYVTNNNVNKYIVSAQESIDKLPSCSEKTALQDRITKVKNQIKNNFNSALKMQAEPLVRQAELFKKSQYFVRAWGVVNQMSASDIKTSYMDRLKALGSDLEIK